MAHLELEINFYGPDPEALAAAVAVMREHMRTTIRKPDLNIERGYMEYTLSAREAGGMNP